MFPDHLQFALYLGLPFLLGAACLRLLGIGFRANPLSWVGWSWMLGTLATGVLLGAWLSCSPDTSRAVVPSALLLGTTFLIFLGARRLAPTLIHPAAEPSANEGWVVPAWERWFFRGAVAFVLAATLERVLYGSLFAVITSDEGSFWAFRAKVLFHAGGFGADYAAGIRETGQGNADYPLLNPLLQVWSFVTAGHITHVANRVIIQLFCPALVLVLAGGLRRLVRPGFAALFLLLLPTMQPFLFAARHAYSDVMVALGAVVVLDAHLRWRRDGRRAWLWLAGLGVAFALASKNDGVLVATAVLGALVLSWLLAPRGERATLRPNRSLLVVLPALLVAYLGRLHNDTFEFRNTFFEGAKDSTVGSGELGGGSKVGAFLDAFTDQISERIGPILEFFGREVFFAAGHSWFLFTVFCVLCLCFLPHIRRSALRFGACYVGLLLTGLMLVFITLPSGVEYHLRTAGARVVMDALPAAMLWIAAFSGIVLGAHGEYSAEAASGGQPGSGQQLSKFRGAVLLFLLVTAGLSVKGTLQRLGAEGGRTLERAVHWSEDERLSHAFRMVDGRYALDDGVFRGVYDALVEHVPESGTIVVSMPSDPSIKLAWILRSVLYPRRFILMDPRPGELVRESDLLPMIGQVWILDLVGATPQLEPHFTQLASGPGWSFWR